MSGTVSVTFSFRNKKKLQMRSCHIIKLLQLGSQIMAMGSRCIFLSRHQTHSSMYIAFCNRINGTMCHVPISIMGLISYPSF